MGDPMRERPEGTYDLLGPVGNGRPSRPVDLLWLRAALATLGRHGPAHRDATFVDRDLDDAIRGYQRDRELRVDGWLGPDGPTHCCLRFDLASLEDE